MRKFIVFLIMMSFITMPVKAACSYAEKATAMTKAANVKVDYEVVEEKEEDENGTAVNEYFKISILNITEELYVTVTNDVTDETKTFTYGDAKDGIVTFDWDNTETVTNFIFKVYATSKTPCEGEELKTLRKQTPRYNDFYNRAICADMKDFYLCQKYTNLAEIDESMFIDKVDGYVNGKIDEDGKDTNTTKKKTALDIIKEYKWYIIGGCAIIIVGGVIVVTTRKRNRGKLVK